MEEIGLIKPTKLRGQEGMNKWAELHMSKTKTSLNVRIYSHYDRGALTLVQILGRCYI